MKQHGIFVEVTTLIIPGLNDSEEELRDLSTFLARDLGPETPWHISRFHPTYRMTDRPATPVGTLARAREIGIESGLRYVYTGNVPGHEGENTFCYQCGKTVIGRWGYQIEEMHLENGCCGHCGAKMDGLAL
jgi:pyruvate formate lyase activating enzyme